MEPPCHTIAGRHLSHRFERIGFNHWISGAGMRSRGRGEVLLEAERERAVRPRRGVICAKRPPRQPMPS
jgi:hypothetical protein